MKLGFVTAILHDLTLEEVMTFASENDYDCIEVMCWPVGKAERRYAGVTHIDVNDLTQAKIEDIKALQNDLGVEISGLGYYPNPLTPDPDEATQASEHIKKVIEGAEKLGISVVNSFIGRDWKKSVDENWPRFLEVWKPIIEHAEKHNIRVGIENCPMSFTADEWPGGKNLAGSPAIWRRMFDDIPSDHFGLNFDPSHFIWQHMDYLKAIREFAPKFFHAHAKDVRIDVERRDQVGIMGFPLEYHTPKIPGMGDVDWGQFFSALTDSGYDGAVCVEVEDRSFEGTLDRRKKSLIQSKNYLRQYIP